MDTIDGIKIEVQPSLFGGFDAFALIWSDGRYVRCAHARGVTEQDAEVSVQFALARRGPYIREYLGIDPVELMSEQKESR